jgi:hypothetical protein
MSLYTMIQNVIVSLSQFEIINLLVSGFVVLILLPLFALEFFNYHYPRRE